MEKIETGKERKIKINFFKKSGKWYSSGTATVNHYIFEDEYKQDIVNTQNSLLDGWQDHEEFFVVTSEFDPKSYDFDEVLFHPGEFKGLKREGELN